MSADTRPIDAETRATSDDHHALRLWLRLYACTSLVESRVRRRLQARFGTTLPRFDLMAQLQRYPQGLKMGELSRRMMVTGGNVTGLTDQLVREGLVERRPIASDRRAHAVCLTAKGRSLFDAMAREHERWIIDLTEGVTVQDRDRLFRLLGSLKQALAASLDGNGDTR